jgi:hypothetical protein
LLLLLASLASSQDSCVIDVVNYTPQNLTIFTYDGSDTKCINPFETYIVPPPYLPGNQAGRAALHCTLRISYGLTLNFAQLTNDLSLSQATSQCTATAGKHAGSIHSRMC